jgi:cyclohexadieny/prephenate dehydrogenase
VTQPLYPVLTVIGCGLIGSSILRAARAEGLAATLIVCDRDPVVRARAVELGLADKVLEDSAEGVAEADLVVLSAPVGVIGAIAREIAPHLKPGATLTDTGSVKAGPAREMAAAAPQGVFAIPGHPIAGTEFSGPDAGFAALFHKRWTILTPLRQGDAAYDAAVERLAAFWRALGSQVETMDETHHDLVLAVTSHLPHLIAYTIVGSAADLEEVTRGEVMKYSAGGFRDFTRIASSDPVMWRDVFLNNRDAVLEVLGRFSQDLEAMAQAIRGGNGDALHDHFARTREIRRGIVALGQENAAPNFGRDRPADAGGQAKG